ncbi:MAG: DUF4147 domain-containing protein [Planctomycetaceae bacterium]
MSDSTPNSLRNDALAIWRAGVDAVRSDRLVEQVISSNNDQLEIAGESVILSKSAQIAVVGGGKAGTGMAIGCERALRSLDSSHRRTGWLNIPADCVQPTDWIHLHPARPAGLNEPTAAGVAGTEKILDIVSELGPEDICLVLLSGGGSALLPAPVKGISLADKQAVTRFLMKSGATITDLNRVRRKLSAIKGGGLLRECRAGRMFVLVLSDVLNDPLDIIASGPTIPDDTPTRDVITLLRSFPGSDAAVPQSVWTVLQQLADQDSTSLTDTPTDHPSPQTETPCRVRHHVIGNNRTALTQAAQAATERGYTVVDIETNIAGVAADLGRNLARRALELRHDPNCRPLCLLSGGEPIVLFDRTADDTTPPPKGGRNQELALAALVEFGDIRPDGIVLLSGGTDGEDGPTDAAGGIADLNVWQQARTLQLDPLQALATHESYNFLQATGGLIQTGPTHTNVMDLRVVLIDAASPVAVPPE